jgi:hypothetical protein
MSTPGVVQAKATPSFVMPALVAGIHDFLDRAKDVDGRDKPGHDG